MMGQSLQVTFNRKFDQIIPDTKIELYKEKSILLICSLLEVNSQQVFELFTPQKIMFYMQALAQSFIYTTKKNSLLNSISRAFALSLCSKSNLTNFLQEKKEYFYKLLPFSNVAPFHYYLIFVALSKMLEFEDDDLNVSCLII